MFQSERDEKMIERLKIKPLNHGQIHTFQIAAPDLRISAVSADRIEALKQSLSEQSNNLIPIIVRRTDKYSEDEQFEVVYGFDWYLAAKEIDFEKLWVWVFDLTDEQVVAVQREMNQILNVSPALPLDNGTDLDSDRKVEALFRNLEISLQKSIRNYISEELQRLEDISSNRILKQIERSLDDKLQQKSDEVIEKIKEMIIPKPPVGGDSKWTVEKLKKLTVAKLQELAMSREIDFNSKTRKLQLIEKLMQSQSNK